MSIFLTENPILRYNKLHIVENEGRLICSFPFLCLLKENKNEV